MAKRLRHIVLLLAASLLLVGISAATQVTFAESTTGQVIFTNVDGNQSDVTFGYTGDCGEGGNNCVAGFGLYGSTLGTYKMWITGGPPQLTPPNAFDIYGVDLHGATMNFSMLLSDSHSSLLEGVIDLQMLSGGSTRAPEFLGEFTPSFVSGAFSNDFTVGVTGPDDFTITLSKTADVDVVFNSQQKGMSIQGPISSGEILPGTPEPGSLVLMGTGLLSMAALLKRRLF